MSLPGRETHLETLGTVVQEEIVVTGLGMATHGWNRICPKPSNFHLVDSMGQAIPLAAGLALATHRPFMPIPNRCLRSSLRDDLGVARQGPSFGGERRLL